MHRLAEIVLSFVLISPHFLFSNFKGLHTKDEISFTENKGQIRDQFNARRNDILFGGTTKGLVFHLNKSGISYQLSRVDAWKTEDALNFKAKTRIIEKQTVYRLDVNWMNCNKDANVKKMNPLVGYDSFYFEGGEKGILGVKKYKEIWYEQIYSGIDLRWYSSNGVLKYDYLVAPGANYKEIQLDINGASKITLNSRGELLIHTPLGVITEQAPIIIQDGKKSKAKWKIVGSTVSFEIKDINPKHSFTIDPAIRSWGTYYGGTLDDIAYSCTTDLNKNVYLAGNTESAGGALIATVGSYQYTFGGGTYDAFLAKLDSNGVRLWATYYGGNGNDYGSSCATDNSGNVYLTGSTGSSVSIATAGSHQTSYGGGSDAFLAAFNSSGIRQWATYYGGSLTDGANGCCIDSNGNIFICGSTLSNNAGAISTVGSHQSASMGSWDAFLVKFSSAGVRQWGTYYGGAITDIGSTCCTDTSNNIYIAGYTSSNSGTNIASVGSHQSAYGGGSYDAFLVKFSSSGIRQWGTYYGGSGDDAAYSAASSPSGNVYFAGHTSSSTGTALATGSSHQPVYGGGSYDAFLVQFNSSGVRQWGTYYGGPGTDDGYGCNIDPAGNGILVGRTDCTTSAIMTTPGSQQTIYGGWTFDAFFGLFNSSGVRQIATYYSGIYDDIANACCADQSGNYYIAGSALTPSGTAIASPGSYQTSLMGYTDGFIAKLINCMYPAPPVNVTPAANQSVCANNATTTLMANAAANISWYTTPTSTFALGSGTSVVTPSLAPGTYTLYAEAISCIANPVRTPITFTIFPATTISVNSGSICLGNSFTITPSGAVTYSIQGGNAIVSPTANSIYTVSGYLGGCQSTNIATANVVVNALPLPTITANSGSICQGSSFTIVPAGANSYTFSSGFPVVSPSVNTSYSITGTSTAGCISSVPAISNVSVLSTPTVTVNSGTICAGSNFTLVPSGANSYTYQGGNSVVSPMTSTTYTIIGSDIAGCVSLIPGSASITVNPLPTVSVNSGSICSGQSFTMFASGAATYTYSSGSPIVSPTVNTTYSISGTSSLGCISSLTICNVTVNLIPTITVNSGSICSGNSFTIFPFGANSYTITGASSVVSPTVTSTYSIGGTSINGCASSSPAVSTVVVVALPLPTITVNSGSICAGQVFTIIPTGANSYSISGGSSMVNPLISTTYTVTGTSTNGCISQNNAICNVSVIPLPTLSILATPLATVCAGDSATLTVICSASNYTWNTGAETQSIIISPTIAANYWVTITDSSGCQNIDAVNIALCTGFQNNFSVSHDINLFPIPAGNEVFIDFHEAVQKNLELYNSLGQIIYKMDLRDSATKINLESFPSGVYFLKVSFNTDNTCIKRIIKL